MMPDVNGKCQLMTPIVVLVPFSSEPASAQPMARQKTIILTTHIITLNQWAVAQGHPEVSRI
jgi:hypothetical protein